MLPWLVQGKCVLSLLFTALCSFPWHLTQCTAESLKMKKHTIQKCQLWAEWPGYQCMKTLRSLLPNKNRINLDRKIHQVLIQYLSLQLQLTLSVKAIREFPRKTVLSQWTTHAPNSRGNCLRPDFAFSEASETLQKGVSWHSCFWTVHAACANSSEGWSQR